MRNIAVGVVVLIMIAIVGGVLWMAVQSDGTPRTPLPTATVTLPSEMISPAPTPTVSNGMEENQISYALVSIEAEAGGETFGCGDSIVMVQEEVSGSTGVEAALEALFNTDNEQYHNALSNSDLSVDRVEEDDGALAVYLEGQLSLAGVCDNPRVEKQLMRTVLENTDATNFVIYINEETLEEALSLQ